MEVLRLSEQFVLVASKRKEPEQVVSHFVSTGEKKSTPAASGILKQYLGNVRGVSARYGCQ